MVALKEEAYMPVPLAAAMAVAIMVMIVIIYIVQNKIIHGIILKGK